MERNKVIDIMKGLAIISVIFAHSSSNNAGYQHIFNVIGLFGVPVFFFVAGFLFKNSTLKNLLFKKKSILIKWLISGSIIYLYVYLRKYNLSLVTYLNFLFGFNSYLYFLTCYFIILIIMYILFTIRKIYIEIFFLFLSFIFLQNTKIFIFGSIRPLIFFCYFYLGYFFKSHGLSIFSDKKVSVKDIITFLLCVILIVIINKDINYVSYYGFKSTVTCLLGIVCLYYLSIIINHCFNSIKFITIELGKNTLDIYLWHMMFIGIINRMEFIPFLFKPILTITVTYFFIKIVHIFINLNRGKVKS